ncbi:putative hemagglutinin-related protein [Flavobacteria bacterium BAL38]|nr:putative hemagglutinin-related protein [Flavobacteria bacterium BAL38]
MPYTGGNGVAYPSGTSIASIGVTGLSATLNAGTLANGPGNFTFTITGTPDPFVSVSNTATATFPFTFDGKNCSFTVTIDKARIGSTISCSTAVVENPATGINGSPYNGTITVTYSNSILTNGGAYAAQSITSTGVTGLTATISSGFVNPAGGTLVFNVTGTPNSTGNAQFNLSNFINGLTCSGSNVQIVISGTPLVSGLNCSAASHSPATATQFDLYSGTTILPYTGGNGRAYTTQSINSTGVSGLTATLTPGTLASGSGNLSFTVTGIPNSSGLASFEVNFGGQTCVFSIRVNGKVISISYIDGSSYYSTSEFGQQTVPQNYGPTGIFNTIGGLLHDDYTSTLRLHFSFNNEEYKRNYCLWTK